MAIGLHFQPDAARARQLNARMHRELAGSLRHVAEESREILAFDLEALTKVIQNLENGVDYPPATFARYYDLVEAIIEDRHEDAERLCGEICVAQPWRNGLEVEVLGAPELGAESDRFIRMMNSDASVDLGFGAPQPEMAAGFRERLSQGLDLLQRGLPELSGEVRAIVREIVIAGGDASKRLQFDGGSHYRLWGALFLNCQFHPNALAVVEALAHESAHSLLFGFCTDLPLVENEDDERFSSPLRTDPRPMEGIYHATFVSARMHWAMTSMAKTDLLTPEARDQALAAAKADARNFYAGYGVLAEHGQLTSLGAGLIAEAKAYMDAQQ